MTLPFRRRHHDDEAVHDRARAIVAASFLEPVSAEDEAWLEGHLAACGDCSLDRAHYLADRTLLRTLRDDPPPPPRDLWARTSAAIEREAAHAGRPLRPRARRRGVPGGSVRRRAGPLGLRLGGVPLGALSGVLVAAVVLAVSLIPRSGPVPAQATPGGSDVAVASGTPGPTPLAVRAGAVGWMRPTADGRVELVFSNVDSVCSDAAAGCAPLADSSASSITLAAPPSSVVLSPSAEQLVLVPGAASDPAGTVLVVPVPTAAPAETPAASGASPSAAVTVPPTPAATPTLGPGETAAPTPAPTPEGARTIATGVTVVGDGAYSPDGLWFAFAARPIDGSAGPDLYLWRVGSASAARATTDGSTYFAGWSGGLVLASHVDEVAPDASAGPSPDASAPAASAAATPAASRGSKKKPGATPAPTATPAPAVGATGRATSFLLDPATGARTPLAVPDAWLPIVDPTGRFVVYWSGTLVLDASGAWIPGDGRLVLDGWSAPLADPLAPTPAASAPATPAAPGSESPSPAASAPLVVGPAGTPIGLAEGAIAAFDAHFDPTGSRLAVWTSETVGSAVGMLRLIVLDPVAGALDTSVEPLAGTPALRGFSIAEGRLAWVTPPGQDGAESSVAVLGWSADAFGQAAGGAARGLVLVR